MASLGGHYQHIAIRFIPVAMCLFLPYTLSAQTDTSLVDRVMARIEAMDFEFSRSESDVPYLPVLSLGHRIYTETQLQSPMGSGSRLRFRSQTTSAYGMVPLYIGQRSLAAVVPYVGHTWFRFKEGDLDDGEVTSIYLPFGSAWQTERSSQLGWFLMPAAYSPLRDDADWAYSGMGGVFGRHFSGNRLTWYYGLVYDEGFGDGYFLPYAGFTYVIDPKWAFTMLAPWPTISYAPNPDFFVQTGIAPSAATWSLNPRGDNNRVIASFGGWDMGTWANWRLNGPLWMSAGIGFSGLRSFTVNEQGDASFDQRLDREPWVSLSIHLRPEP